MALASPQNQLSRLRVDCHGDYVRFERWNKSANNPQTDLMNGVQEPRYSFRIFTGANLNPRQWPGSKRYQGASWLTIPTGRKNHGTNFFRELSGFLIGAQKRKLHGIFGKLRQEF